MRFIIAFILLFASSAFAYERESFGTWIDVDKDCLNTRQEILQRDSSTPVVIHGCIVRSGKWLDPYSNKVFTLPSGLDIDHIIPLKYAELHGAKNWPRAQKRAFANDPENLIAVSANQNRSKGDKGPYTWMPVNKSHHCKYAQSWKYLAEKYKLTLNITDTVKINIILSACK